MMNEKYDDYLKDVIFLARDSIGILEEKLSNDLKKNIMEKSFKSFTEKNEYFTMAYDKISKVLPTNDKIENEYKKNTKVEINISKINDVDSQKDEWIPGTINKISRDGSNIIYRVKIDNSVDISKYKNNPDIDIANKTIAFKNKNFIHLPNWKDCVKDCYSTCHEYVKNEVESTAYMLRILSASVLGDTKNYKIGFYINGDVFNYPNIISGKWNDDTKEPDKKSPYKNIIQDKEVFQIEICNVSIVDGKTTIINYTKPKNGRFILGAGPSASGKTYNAGLMIQMMKMVDPLFPDFFMTIDGGTYREKSVIYQTIVDAVKNKNQYPGLTNLMSASVLDKFRGVQSIFETDSIKKVINDYLLEQKKKKNFVVSLYVPDTLTYCGIPTNCIPKLEKYIDITGDNNWIGLMIYQHKNGGDKCPFKSEYKCVGCTESGKSREKTEGKKYSSGAWKMSYDHGLQTIKKAPNYRIVFHNGGKRGTPSIFEDLSEPKIPYDKQEIKDFFTKNKIVYIDGELTENPDCDDYLLKDCKIHKTQQADQNVVRIDEDFVKQYKNKYIAIPKKLIDILDSKNFDNMDDETAALLVMIQKFIESGFFGLTEMDPQKMEGTEKDYNYYQINMGNFDYYKDYDDFETLVESDDIKIYEKETTPPSVFNFFSMPSVSMFSGDKSKIDEQLNKTELKKLDQVIQDNPELENDIENADVVVVDDIETSEKIKNEIAKNSNIESSEKTDEKTGESITIVNVKGDKRPFMKWLTETIPKPVQSLTGVFINRELVDAQGEVEAQGEDETQGDIQGEVQGEVETAIVPQVMNPEEIVNNISSKRYIGIPKTLENSNDNDGLKQHKEDTLNYLIEKKVITKINVKEDSLNQQDGYDETLYDYYELNVDSFIKSQVEFTIHMAKSELTAMFETLSTNNTLYIYENQPETKPTIGEEATNETASSFFGNILGRITGKKPTGTEEEPEEEKGDKSNDKAPKCKKNKTEKKSDEGKTGKSKSRKNPKPEQEQQQAQPPSSLRRSVRNISNVIPNLLNKTKKNKNQ